MHRGDADLELIRPAASQLEDRILAGHSGDGVVVSGARDDEVGSRRRLDCDVYQRRRETGSALDHVEKTVQAQEWARIAVAVIGSRRWRVRETAVLTEADRTRLRCR